MLSVSMRNVAFTASSTFGSLSHETADDSLIACCPPILSAKTEPKLFTCLRMLAGISLPHKIMMSCSLQARRQRKILCAGKNILRRLVMTKTLVLPDLARGPIGHQAQPCVDVDRN